MYFHWSKSWGKQRKVEKTQYWKRWNETWNCLNLTSFLQDAGVAQLCETKASATGRHGGFGQIPV